MQYVVRGDHPLRVECRNVRTCDICLIGTPSMRISLHGTMYANRHTHRQTCSQTDKKINSQTHRQYRLTDRLSHRQTKDSQTNKSLHRCGGQLNVVFYLVTLANYYWLQDVFTASNLSQFVVLRNKQRSIC